MKNGWKVVESEYIFQRPWLTVRRESLVTHQGKSVPEYYVLEYPTWVNTIAITRDGRFLFVRQYRHGLGREDYELCAGVCDPEDSSPLEAARRELLEETGYGNGEWQQHMVISANPATHTNLTYCYIATNVELLCEQSLDATEELSVHLLTKEEVINLLENDQIKQALNAAPLWRYAAKNF